MHTILIIENSKTLGLMMVQQLEATGDFSTVLCTSLSAAKKAMSTHTFLAAIVSLVTKDAFAGESVDTVLAKKIPVIVFTGSFSDSLQKEVWEKPIIDYVVKDNPDNINYIISQLHRLIKNNKTKVLVVDDSGTTRTYAANLLRNHRYEVYEAVDGFKALDVLKMHPDIKLALVDYNMPNMDGFQLIQNIRKTKPKFELAIIGMTSDLSRDTSAHFIKNGANDFIMKPYLVDEFYCRVNQNIETIDNIEIIRHASDTDYLTGLYNRRFLFRESEKYFETPENEIAVAMFDIDSFKRINDTYGHLDGDTVIKHLADKLTQKFSNKEIICRFGGDELCIFFPDISKNDPLIDLELLRQDIEKSVIKVSKGDIKITISIGVCIKRKETVEKMIYHADNMLYEAKNQGKNQVVIDNELSLDSMEES